MLETIEKLLILQDRDRNVERVEGLLAQIGPERQTLLTRTANTQAALEAAKLRGKQIETERKKLELEVEAKKQQIEKYSLQQFQTRKNEEYRALAHEIELCKADIVKLEDQELDLMERAEAAQKAVVAGTKAADEAKKLMDQELAELASREESLKKELSELQTGRDQLAAEVEPGARGRYDRLFRQKGGRVLVGVQHGVCGGCHMKLPPQLVISCQTHQELVACPNCARILYYASGMDLAVAE